MTEARPLNGELDKDLPDLFVRHARLCLEMSASDAALTSFQRAVTIGNEIANFPAAKIASMLTELSYIQHERGDFPAAQATITEAIELSSADSAEGLTALAARRLYLGKTLRALGDLGGAHLRSL